MNTRTWVHWPDAPGFWWMALGDSDPVMALVDDDLDVHDIERNGWWFRADAEDFDGRCFRFLPTGLVRPSAPPRSA